MKYQISTEIIPQADRAEVNNKILMLIASNNLQGISHEQIFQAYTGNGGLHGLNRNDFESYSDFSKAKKEIEQGQFFTPPALCQKTVSAVPVSDTDTVADLTFGVGSFFNFMPVESNCYGCELDASAVKVASFLYPKANLIQNDIRFYRPEVKFDFIFGNPPFNLYWNIGKDKIISQLFYIDKAHATISEGGLMTLIVPQSFLSDEFIDGNIIKQVEAKFSFLCQAKIPANAFKAMGVSSFETKVMFFQKRSEHIAFSPYKHDEFVSFNPEMIKTNFILPALQAKKSVRHNLLFNTGMEAGENNYSRKNSAQRPNDGFAFQLRKLLFEIKTHPASRKKYAQAINLVEKFKTQVKPDGVSYEEWEKQKLTENKVLAHLKRSLYAALNPKPVRPGFYAIRHADGVRLYASGQENRDYLKAMNVTTWFPLVDLLNTDHPFHGHRFEKLLKPFAKQFEKKRKMLSVQRKPFSSLKNDKSISRFIKSYTFVKKDGSVNSLNEVQAGDLKLTLQKPYGSILAWQQGSGKTPAGYGVLSFKRNAFGNQFIVSTPLAATLTWEPFLKLQKENFIVVTCAADFDRIQPGQIVLIAITTVQKQLHYLKRFLKLNSHNAMLLFDESDYISSYNSKRSKAMRVFKKLPYKILTTGTTTRNNIAELYGQLELIFNNSYGFTSDSEFVYHEIRDKETGISIKSAPNDQQHLPFTGRTGFAQFKKSFSPTKSTVFGINKHNQDIYNRFHLEQVIGATIQTRQFKEVVGDGKYQMITHTVRQKKWEEDFYVEILEEFSKMLGLFYSSTGNQRKDSMLRIIRQINLLIKACSIPNLMTKTNDRPTKTSEIIRLLSKNDTRTMVGCITKRAVAYYQREIMKAFPDREVFVITGDTGSIKNRQLVIDEFEKTSNGVLISTQQALSESVNIPMCKEVIIESLRWNMPRVHQYIFRAIRFDSVGVTNVHFVVYERSIEVNLMALLADKERLNDFVKTLEIRGISDVFNEFALDMDFLDIIINRVQDDEGKMKLAWGKQKAA